MRICNLRKLFADGLFWLHARPSFVLFVCTFYTKIHRIAIVYNLKNGSERFLGCPAYCSILRNLQHCKFWRVKVVRWICSKLHRIVKFLHYTTSITAQGILFSAVFRILTCWCESGSGSADPCLWMDPDADPDPAIFANTNLKKNFCLLLFEGTFTSFFKDKKSKKSHKTVRIKVFLTILLDDKRMIEGRIHIRIHTSD